jgi:hypothetical protein
MMSLVDAVVAVARADTARWAQFRLQAAVVTKYETDYAAEKILRECFRYDIRWIDGWTEQFILDLFTEAANGRCTVRGFVGLRKIKLPSNFFLSDGFVNDNFTNKERLRRNELRLPDGTLISAVDVKFSADRHANLGQENLNQALLDLALKRGQKLKQNDEEARRLLKNTGATTRQITTAFRALPKAYRYGKGKGEPEKYGN